MDPGMFLESDFRGLIIGCMVVPFTVARNTGEVTGWEVGNQVLFRTFEVF